MKKNLSKIIVVFIIFLLGVGVGFFTEKKLLEKKYNLASNSTSQVLEQIKSVGNNENTEDKKKALQDAYTEIEKLVQKELDLQVEVIRLENEINNPTDLNESDSVEDGNETKPAKENIEAETETEKELETDVTEEN